MRRQPKMMDIGHARMAAALVEMRAERDALAAFKAYAHERMDGASIPTHPEGAHSAEGCRIGDRFDILIGQRDVARAEMRLLHTELLRLREENKALAVARNNARTDVAALREALDDTLPFLCACPTRPLKDAYAAAAKARAAIAGDPA